MLLVLDMFLRLSDLKEIKISTYIPLDPNFVFVCRIINEYKVSAWLSHIKIFLLQPSLYIMRCANEPKVKIRNSPSFSLSLSLFVYVGTTLCFHESCCILLLSTQILGDCQRATSICDIPRRYESVPMECIHVIQANCFSSEHCFN